MPISYKDAGVDLDAYAEAMGRLPALMERTRTPRVLPLAGGFAGLFQLQGDGNAYRDPVLVSGTDGVGTKLKVAMRVQRFDTLGIDLVAMCVNDCICLGAEPLFFLDYLALSRDDPELTAALVSGISEGCVEAGAALVGGETAIMPDLYGPGEFDMAGFCVGVVERDQIIDGSRIRPGDVLVGIESSGIHSNGFSLVRKAVFDVGGLEISDPVPEVGGVTVGELLLVPTRIYAGLIRKLTARDGLRERLHGIAHITGGGLEENVQRILPEGMQPSLDREAWTVPPVFDWIQRLGDIDSNEMDRVFNMGIGLVIVIPEEAADGVRQAAGACGWNSYVIGSVSQK